MFMATSISTKTNGLKIIMFETSRQTSQGSDACEEREW